MFPPVALTDFHYLRDGKIRCELLADGDRTGTRAPATVRGAERLVGVVVHHVDTEVAGAGDAEDRVHVRAVEVQKRAGVVDQLRHLDDVRVELPDRVRVRHHHGGDFVREVALEVFQVGQPVRARLDVDHARAAHRAAGRVRAVGRVGGEYDAALGLAVVFEVRADDFQRGPLAVRAGAGLER